MKITPQEYLDGNYQNRPDVAVWYIGGGVAYRVCEVARYGNEFYAWVKNSRLCICVTSDRLTVKGMGKE